MALVAGSAALTFDNATPPNPDFTGGTGMADALCRTLQPIRFSAASVQKFRTSGLATQFPNAIPGVCANIVAESNALASAIVSYLAANGYP